MHKNVAWKEKDNIIASTANWLAKIYESYFIFVGAILKHERTRNVVLRSHLLHYLSVSKFGASLGMTWSSHQKVGKPGCPGEKNVNCSCLYPKILSSQYRLWAKAKHQALLLLLLTHPARCCVFCKCINEQEANSWCLAGGCTVNSEFLAKLMAKRLPPFHRHPNCGAPACRRDMWVQVWQPPLSLEMTPRLSAEHTTTSRENMQIT